jgi:hypothetical protein
LVVHILLCSTGAHCTPYSTKRGNEVFTEDFLQEKAVHGFLIATAILFTPAWVLSHIKEYRSPKGAADE